MGKLAQNFAKYTIAAELKANGVIEKPDVIGAIFGQTEGLLGSDLDLRELQRTGRVGRIEVKVKSSNGSSIASILIPCSLDASETSLIASSLETIEKVGPCEAEIIIKKVEDVRSQKRKYVVDRAKEILKSMIDDGMPDSQRLTEMIKQAVRSWEVSEYHGLSCGPDIDSYDEIILVEGRADVINLLKNGVRNVIAIEGSKVPEVLINISKEKITTAFLDGDRGGTLDLKKLLSVADIDFIAFADEGEEVEDLSKKQIYKSLRERIPRDSFDFKTLSHDPAKKRRDRFGEAEISIVKASPIRVSQPMDQKRKAFFSSSLEELVGSRAVYIINKNMQIMAKVPMSELMSVIENYRDADSLVFDGKINQDIIDLAIQRKISSIVGTDLKGHVKYPETLSVVTWKELSQ